ncbi:helix-turn-helix transcriptional regulator [Azorhizobium doebereinerae]|uniref:helix-turn-helix transcriptional regulator n=1 Tax=Azorhizobium doebereinerae TaxID=281091 RepID=UPI00048D6747|nr:helix-turn-helix transcriptional regulator [Azorhizobium doebereinerae]
MITAPDMARRRALAGFVRAQRERLDPAGHGFLDLRRRRTPGLRREEMAQIAGLSATWYTWIEQARDVSLSASAVARLARAFGLSPAERAYLFDLAGREDPEPPGEDPPGTLNPLLRMIEALPYPAYMLDGAWTARAWNGPAAELFRGWLDGAAERNLLRFIFLSPAAVALIPDHAERARRVLAEFRADTSRHMAEPALAMLVAELKAGAPLFARLWEAQAVLGREGGLRLFRDAEGALVQFEQVTLVPLPGGRSKLVVLTPFAP